MAKPPRNRQQTEFVAILHEMDSADDRTAAIVAAAFVENNLALAILARLRILTEAEQRNLFENRGILADFSAKIDMGYALNIYGSLVRDDLDKIGQIRNRFAHDLQVRDFDNPEVAGKCDALNARKYLDSLARPKKTSPITRKEIYLDTAAHLAARLDMEAKAGKHRPTEGHFRIGSDY
jgi:hypothetical protein